MNKSCEEVEQKLKLTDKSTKFLLEHAEGLRKESQSIATKQLLSKVFLHRFTLTPKEIESLTKPEIELKHELFETIDHCEEIRKNCAYLLSSKDSIAGLDIMKSINIYLDRAYDKIFKSMNLDARNGFIKLNHDFKEINSNQQLQLEVNSLIKKSIHRLKKRPELLNEVLSTLTKARSNILLNSFLDALTRGGPSGLPRPIELNAHDPIRYLGDMLAWIHQTMASEHEFLESLFDLKSDGRRVGQTRCFEGEIKKVAVEEEEEGGGGGESSNELIGLDDRQRTIGLLDQHLEGCSRPLKFRIVQTIKSQEGSLMTYQLAGLLEFYQSTMENTIGPQAKLTQTLNEMTQEAYLKFYELLKSLTEHYLENPEAPPVDLSIPNNIHEIIQNLKEMMKIYEGTKEEGNELINTNNNNNNNNNNRLEIKDEESLDRNKDLRGVFEKDCLEMINSCVWDLIEIGCKFRGSDWDKSIFWVNCLEFVQNSLKAFSFTKSIMEKNQKKLDEHIKILTEEHFRELLKISGLETIYQTILTKDPDIPLSRIDKTNMKSIQRSIEDFDKFLKSDEMIMMTLNYKETNNNNSNNSNNNNKLVLLLMNSQIILKKIHNESLKKLRLVYEMIFDEVHDIKNLYEFSSSIFIRSKEEVYTLMN